MIPFLLACLSLLLIFADRHAPVHAEERADACRSAFIGELQEERRAYRAAQFGEEYRSVLGAENAKTSDLVPYLTLNYQAFACRARMICDVVSVSHGHTNEAGLKPHRPIGCSRLLATRGRWWSDDRRDELFRTEPITACAYHEQVDTISPSALTITLTECSRVVSQMLAEERQFLKLMVAQDTAERGSKRVIGTFQIALFDLRDSLLHPLRGLADLFGSVLHPIPCLLSQCN